MRHPPLRLLMICAAAMSFALRADWPAFSGDGTFSPSGDDYPTLIESAEQARLDWFNPVMTGVGKTGAGGYLGTLERGADGAFFGGVSNLIVADGKVFATFTRPSGEVVADRDTVRHRYYSAEDMARLPDETFRILADDVTVAIDAESGETLWTAVEAGESLNALSNKRGLSGISGVHAGGRFYAMGWTGRIYAYDAGTGARLWDYTVSEWHQRMMERRAGHVRDRTLPVMGDTGEADYQRGGLVAAEGTLVAPDLRGGLVGLDIDTGEERWAIPGVIHTAAVPVPWRHADRTFLLTTGPGRGADTEGSIIRLIDPRNGSTVWSFVSGPNRATLVMEGDRLLLQTRGDAAAEAAGFAKGHGRLGMYRIGPEGLEELWRLPDEPRFHHSYRPDAGRRRRAVFHDGVLYVKLGMGEGVGERIYSFDAETGETLQASEEEVDGNVSLPYVVDGRMFWHLDVAHSGGRAGLRMYRLTGRGRFEPAGSLMFTSFNVYMSTGYELPMETPVVAGRMFLRGMPGVAAIDLRHDPDPSRVELELHGAWAGVPSPLEVRLSCSDTGEVLSGKVRPPRNDELGVPLTTARRKNADGAVSLTGPLKVTADGLRGNLELGMGPFSWRCELDLKPSGDGKLEGTWTRDIPALPEPSIREGRIVGTGGWDQRVMPTPWLKHQPLTVYSDLPEGWERMKLALEEGIVDGKGEPRWFTLFLEHHGNEVKGGVGIATQYNQSWHEVDATGLRLEGDRITGEVVVIVNPDPWWAPNPETGTAMAGRIRIDAARGEGTPHDITGGYRVEWGVPLVRKGIATAAVNGMETD